VTRTIHRRWVSAPTFTWPPTGPRYIRENGFLPIITVRERNARVTIPILRLRGGRQRRPRDCRRSTRGPRQQTNRRTSVVEIALHVLTRGARYGQPENGKFGKTAYGTVAHTFGTTRRFANRGGASDRRSPFTGTVNLNIAVHEYAIVNDRPRDPNGYRAEYLRTAVIRRTPCRYLRGYVRQYGAYG